MADSALTLFYEFARNKSLVASQGLGPTLGITRTTEKRVFGSDKLLQTVASGVAGFDHDPVNAMSLGLLVEEARTNLAIHSGDISDAAWVASNMTKGTASVTDPTGGANINVRLTASAANGTLLQTVTSTIDDYSYAVFMKRVTGTGDVQLTVDNGTTWTTKTLTSDWTRFDVSDASETNPVFGVRIVTDTDAIDFWGSDLNKNTIFPTSHIPTVASSVTRNKDDVKSTDVSWFNANAGTFYTDASILSTARTSAGRVVQISDDANNDLMRLFIGTDEVPTFGTVHSSDTNGAVTTPAISASVLTKLACAYADDDVALYQSGTAGTPDSTAAIPLADAMTKFAVGIDSIGNSPLNGHISELRYYNVRKDNQFLEDLSNGLINEDSLSFSRNLSRPLARNLARTL